MLRETETWCACCEWRRETHEGSCSKALEWCIRTCGVLVVSGDVRGLVLSSTRMVHAPECSGMVHAPECSGTVHAPECSVMVHAPGKYDNEY